MALEWKIEDNTGIVKNACKEAIFAALDEVGEYLADEAADELENDPRRVDTSRLKNSMTHIVKGKSVYVGTDVEYAPYVHWGTRRMAPNEFIKNAFERNIDQVKEYILERLRNW